MGKNRQKRGNLAKANRRISKPAARQENKKPPPPPPPPPPLTFLQRSALWWRNLRWWWKVGIAIVSALTTAWASLPHFTISRETVNAHDPMAAQFRFTNVGRLPAWNVRLGCAPNIATAFPNGGSVNISGIQFLGDSIPVVGHNESPVRGCHLSMPGGSVTGSVEAVAVYNIPLLWLDMTLPRNGGHL
jgi:hypothetical protein